MAKIEQIDGFTEINLTNSVGDRGINKFDDVMVVQAMLKYAVEMNPYFAFTNYFPMPNGKMDSETLLNIRTFQMYVREKLNNRVSVDGRIDPAKGIFVSARKPGGKQRLTWTIGQLNAACLEAGLLRGSDDYIKNICKLYPQVNAILSRTAVGSLRLALA
ncbi:MAG: hypothetical protein KDB79_10855 [Acidobacteria bacterium]|nr:hypothetical protein [Acidobacteriota bacterium]